MLLPIELQDWYWSIGGTPEVYSSKRNMYVPTSDTAYAEWQAASNMHVPPTVGTEEDAWYFLKQVLPHWLWDDETKTMSQPGEGQYTKTQLKNYSANTRRLKHQDGIIVNGIPFPTDTVTLSALNSAVIYTADTASDTFSWKLPDGSFITLDSQGVKDLQNAVSKFGQDCFDCEDQTAIAIDAGTITDLPPIDAAFDAVSNEFTSVAVQRRKQQRRK